jgi:aerobic-type carbon monoxide dehydrogenase small subunit (CoxS/CutS family)
MNAGLAGVLCRCTGHVKVKEAVRQDHQLREAAKNATAK